MLGAADRHPGSIRFGRFDQGLETLHARGGDRLRIQTI